GVGGDVVGNLNGALATGGFTTWTGPISLASDASIGNIVTGNLAVNINPVSLNGHTLVLNNAGTANLNTPLVDGAGGSGSPVVNRPLSAGPATLTAASTSTGSTLVLAGTLSLTGNGSLASTDIQVNANIGPTPNPSYPGPVGLLVLDNGATLIGDRLPDNATL